MKKLERADVGKCKKRKGLQKFRLYLVFKDNKEEKFELGIMLWGCREQWMPSIIKEEEEKEGQVVFYTKDGEKEGYMFIAEEL